MKNVLTGPNVICGNFKKVINAGQFRFSSLAFFLPYVKGCTLFRYIYPSARRSSYIISVKIFSLDENKVTQGSTE